MPFPGDSTGEQWNSSERPTSDDSLWPGLSVWLCTTDLPSKAAARGHDGWRGRERSSARCTRFTRRPGSCRRATCCSSTWSTWAGRCARCCWPGACPTARASAPCCRAAWRWRCWATSSACWRVGPRQPGPWAHRGGGGLQRRVTSASSGLSALSRPGQLQRMAMVNSLLIAFGFGRRWGHQRPACSRPSPCTCSASRWLCSPLHVAQPVRAQPGISACRDAVRVSTYRASDRCPRARPAPAHGPASPAPVPPWSVAAARVAPRRGHRA